MTGGLNKMADIAIGMLCSQTFQVTILSHLEVIDVRRV